MHAACRSVLSESDVSMERLSLDFNRLETVHKARIRSTLPALQFWQRKKCNVWCHLAHALLWIGSTHFTGLGSSTGSISRFTTTASLSLRTRTHSSDSSAEALIS